MKFQITFPHAAPIHQCASEFLSRNVPLLGRQDLTLTWSDRGELLTVTDLDGKELAKAPCPPLSSSEVPIEVKTASIFAWLRSLLEMLRR